jgi:hypothetical protein
MKDAYSLAIDLKNAMTNGREDNFTVLLFRLIAKSDSDNREKFMKGFPVEVAMMDVYKNDCVYLDKFEGDGIRRVDWKGIADRVCGESVEV